MVRPLRPAFTLLLRAMLLIAASLPVMACGDAPAGVEGWWIGTAKGQRSFDVVLVLERNDGGLKGQAAIPALGSLGNDIVDLRAEGDRVTGTLPVMAGTVSIDVSLAGDALEGRLLATPPGAAAPLEMPLRLERTADARKVAGARRYSGQIDAGVRQIMVGLWLAKDEAGRRCAALDIPEQGLEGLPSYVSRAEDGTMTVRMPVPGDATFVLKEAGDDLRGTFSQGALKCDIAFAPLDPAAPLPAPKAKARPQDPKGPFPYTSRTFQIMMPAGHLIEGTFIAPEGASKERPVPAVLLVTGSGPQDRDESIAGHRPFAVLADSLARRGIAVLRCDDRGVGKSTGDHASAVTDDFASDAKFALMTLAGADEVDRTRVGFVGHSEGALAAALAVGMLDEDPKADAKAAFCVMLAGPGVPGDAVLREQNAALMRAAGKSDADTAAERAAHAALLDAVAQGAPAEVTRARARELVLEQLRLGGMEADRLPPDAIDQQADAAVAQLSAPWMKRFLALDPAVALRKVTCPVLALNGSLDAQVTPQQNLPAIEKALAEARVPATVRVMPGLNHLFQPAKTGGLDEYASIDTTIDPAVLQAVADWVLAQPPRPPASR